MVRWLGGGDEGASKDVCCRAVHVSYVQQYEASGVGYGESVEFAECL